MSDSGCYDQTARSKPYHNSKFLEHMNGEVPGYGQDAEIMQRLYGSGCFTQSSTSTFLRIHSGVSVEPVKEGESRNTSSSDESMSSHQYEKAHSTIRLRTGRRAISKMKQILKSKAGRHCASSSESSFQSNAATSSQS